MANKIGLEIWACLILRREGAHYFQATGIWASYDQDSATLNLKQWCKDGLNYLWWWEHLGLWWLWCPQADVLIRQWFHGGCFSWVQLAFLGSGLFFEPHSPALPINNVSSDIILIHSSFHFFAPKNPTDTTPYLRNQAWATKVFHLDCCNSLGAFCMYCSFCLKYFFAPILVTCFHTSSGLC